jgi:hypothetical protein
MDGDIGDMMGAIHQCSYTGTIATLSRNGWLNIWKCPSCIDQSESLILIALFDLKKGKSDYIPLLFTDIISLILESITLS